MELMELCQRARTKYSLDELKELALGLAENEGFAYALAWTVVNKTTNNDLGKVGEHIANHTYGWTRKGKNKDTDTRAGIRMIEQKTSAPPGRAYRIGQIKRKYDQQQSLYLQFLDLETTEMQYYWFETIEEFLKEFEQWIGNDQGADGNIVGIRSIPHGKPCWDKLQGWRQPQEFFFNVTIEDVIKAV